MNLERLILRLHVLLVVSLLVPQPSKAGYAEEAIQVKPAGFTISQVTHDFSAGQIIVDAEISADPSMVTLLYLPRPNASAAFADSFDVTKHPCELSKNDPCCLNALVSDYQVAPEMAGLYHHNDLCPASGVPAVTGNSLANPALGAVLYPTGIAGSGFLSSGGAPGSYTYDDRVSYTATPVGADKYAIELRFPHAYIADRAIVSAVGGGIKRYEFFVGASFVKLLSYSSLIDVKTIQTNVHYNKADYLFTSVSSEQNRLAFDGINVFLHQGRSQTTNKLYQYLELHLDWNETRYPAASASVVHDSLTLAKSTAHSAVASWLEPCTASTGYYYTAAEKANLDALALETCLPSQPTWCAFAGTRFFVPLPPDTATDSQGWITAADAANQLFVDFVLRLTTPQGNSVFSNVYLSIDLASLVPLAHCDENKFLFVSVVDIVKIQAHVGVQHANDSYTTLNQTSTTNSINYEIAENQNVVAPGRRLLEATVETSLQLLIDFENPDNPAKDATGNYATSSVALSTVPADDPKRGDRTGYFNGVDTSISIDTPLQLPPEVTFAVWFQEDADATQEAWAKVFTFYKTEASSADRIALIKYNNENRYYFNFYDGSAFKNWVFNTQRGVWNFFCVSVQADKTWTLFHNGNLQVLSNQYAPDTSLTYTSLKVGIHANANANNHFHGKIDELAMFNRALTATEISELYENGLARTTTTTAAPVDFSCDAGLVMRYAFDDPLNPGVDSVSGNSAGISGAVTVQDSYANFNDGWVRLEPLTVLEGDDLTFTFHFNPAADSRLVFLYLGDTAVGIIKMTIETENVIRIEIYHPSSGWKTQDVAIVRDGVTWTFISWRIRGSDGYWSITKNEEQMFSGVQNSPKPNTYDAVDHQMGSRAAHHVQYHGSIDDFRIYRSFLSDEQVAAVRAGGPATACAASSSPSPKKKQKVQKVKATMSLPLTVEQFNEDVQLEYRTTIAAVAGVAVAQVQIVSVTASGGGSRRLLQSGGVDVETEIEDDGSGSLEAVGEVLTEEAVNTYIQESGSSTLPTLTMSELTTEVVFFDIPTLGNFSGALSYSDAAIGISFDMTEFIQEASWAAGMRYRVDDAILFNFLNLGANASSFYPALRDAVRDKTLFSIERAGGSGIHHLQMSLPPGVLCDEVTTQGANTILSAANLDCFYRRAIVDDVVQPAASESVFFYRKNNDEEAAQDFIERNMLGSDSPWANETASAYFHRVCPGSLDASATTNTYGCIFADPGYRWLSRHAFSGLDSFLLSDKTILVLLVSVLDASGSVFRRRLLSQDDLEGGIFADHEYKHQKGGGQRSLLQLRDDQTEQVLARLKSESVDSSVAFETSQAPGAAKAAVMKGLGSSRWQLIEMQGLKEAWVHPDTYMRNLKIMLQHLTSFFTKSLRGIEIVSARVQKNGAGGGTSVAGRRLLSTGNSSSEGETDTVDVLGLLRISDFTGAPVYEQEISCVFSELASTGGNLTFEEQFELLLNCQMMREGVFSYPANLTLRECGMGAATLDSRDCLAISLRREMALPSLASSNGNSGDGVSAAWVVVSIVLLSVVGIGILVQGTRQKIVVVTHEQADLFQIIDEKIPLHPMHQPVLSLKEQNI